MPSSSIRPVDWAEFISQNENRLYRTALTILGNPQEAEDAVQDIFVRYLEKAPEDLQNPGAWLMRVLVNACKNRLRHTWRKVVSLPDTLPAPGPEEREELEELWSLSPEERAAIHLFYFEGYSTQEIAQITHCQPGTVRSRLSRARQNLKKLLENTQQRGSLN